MKTSQRLLASMVLTIVSANASLQAQLNYATVSSGLDYNVMQARDVDDTNRIHTYVETTTGLNFKNAAGHWQASKEQISILPSGGAAAVQGQHKVYFPGDIYNSALLVITPDGRQLRSQPLGVSYDDGSNAVLIATLKHSVGYLINSNTVIYRDAFDGFKADYVCYYRRGGFESEIVMRQQPPTPDQYNLNASSSTLQMITEFFDTQDPVQVAAENDDNFGLIDRTLKFGKLIMTRGKAFAMSASNSLAAANASAEIPVFKSWVVSAGRKFLIEEVPVVDLANDLDALPLSAQALPKTLDPKTKTMLAQRPTPRSSWFSGLPRPHQVVSDTNQILFASVDYLKESGVVLDYQSIIGNQNQTGFTFCGDTTYYISGALYLFGTNTFEGGTVIKYATNASINLVPTTFQPSINWLGDAYRPVVMTAKDDNSVGELITGSSGNPTNFYANPALSFVQTHGASVANFRIAYARQAISDSSSELEFCNGQVVNCLNGLTINDDVTIPIRNMLFSHVRTNFNGLVTAFINVQNSTFCDSDLLMATGNSFFGATVDLTLINCIMANVTNCVSSTNGSDNIALSGSFNGFYNSCTFGTHQIASSAYPFQTVGGGHHYLTNDCIFINEGTIDIDATLKANLSKKTTYPPIVYYTPGVSVGTSLNLNPQANRDSDTPDLGYHYDPLDYIFGPTYITNAVISVNPGTTLGMFTSNTWNYGIAVANNAQFNCLGDPNNLNRIVEYNNVQEGTPTGWKEPWYALVTHFNGTNWAINCSFTDWSVMAQDASHVQIGAINAPMALQNCQFHGGLIQSWFSSISLSNCLLERVDYEVGQMDSSIANFQNNTFWQGTFSYWPSHDGSVIQNNLFDGTVIPDGLADDGIAYIGGNNAFVINHDQLDPLQTGDIILNNSPVYQTGWIGNYYLPPNSVLINSGRISADQSGLYHFTTQTNQLKETNSMVDIGYHYVAVDGNGNPFDSNGSGVPDYLEDVNGNGLVDGSESPWLSPPVITTQPATQSVVLGNNVLFTVLASSIVPLHYQWYSPANLLIGATNSSLVISNVQTINAGDYHVVVWNAAGNISSSSAILTVLVPPTITTEPADKIVNQGGTATFSVAATGTTPLIYRWWFNGTNLLAGQTHSGLTIRNAQPANEGTYSVVVTNFAGSVTSRFALLLLPPIITTQPVGQATIQGENVTFNVVAAGSGPLNYQWQCNEVNIAGATSATLTIANAQPSNDGDYTVVVSNLAGSTTSAKATLDVNVPPTIQTQPQDQTANIGGNVTFSVSVNGPELVYQWQTQAGNMSGATSATLYLPNVSMADAGYYRVIVHNPYGEARSPWVALNVNNPPVIITQPQSQTAYVGYNAEFAVGADGGLAQLSYQWQFNNVNIPWAVGSTLTLTNVQSDQAGNYYKVIVSDASGSTESTTASLNVSDSQPSVTPMVSAGYGHCLALRSDGTVWAWGYNANAQLGNGIDYDYSPHTEPAQVPGLAGIIQVSAGAYHSLALKSDGTVLAWGGNLYGELGDGKGGLYNLEPESAIPVVVKNLLNVKKVSAGKNLSVALTDDKTVWAWGNPIYGSVGGGSQKLFPVQINGLSGVVDIVSGSERAWNLAIKDDGTVWKWSDFISNPTLVNNAVSIEQVVCGITSFAALKNDHSVWIWSTGYGNGQFGEFGSGSFGIPSVLPSQPINLSGIQAISEGGEHYVAINSSGSVWAWGLNNSGQAGNGTYQNQPAPALIGSLSEATAISAGQTFSVAVCDNTIRAWGGNGYGELGNGLICNSATPVTVLGLTLRPLLIVSAPENQTICAGATVKFTVVAAGWPLTYQWQKNGVNLSDVGNVSGSTTPTLILTGVSDLDAADYKVLVYDGGHTVSCTAVLVVSANCSPPEIITQPATQTVTAGSDVTFTVTVTASSGRPLKYQWRKDGVIMSDGVRVSGATTATLILSGVTADAEGDYTVTVSNLEGSVNSDVARLNISGSCHIITTQPISQSVVAGTPVTFNVVATGSHYQWFKNGLLLSVPDSSTLSLSNVSLVDAGLYTVYVQGASCYELSQPASLEVIGFEVKINEPKNNTNLP